jgi:hypothetical protein
VIQVEWSNFGLLNLLLHTQKASPSPNSPESVFYKSKM